MLIITRKIFLLNPAHQDHFLAIYISKLSRQNKQKNMALLEEFQKYADKAKALPPTTKDADKLILYGFYKQATVGNVNTDRPGIFSPTDRAKWDAWKAVEGKTKEQAMTEYITKVKELQAAAT